MKGPHCTTCLTPYVVSCPLHPTVNTDGAGLAQCRNGWCSPQKHIQICNCKDDKFWDYYGLIEPDSGCCAGGVCAKHEECEIHGKCPNSDAESDDECKFRWVGQCCTFLVNRQGDRQGRCPNDLDGIADSRVCPECVRAYYPLPICSKEAGGCGEPRRVRYDSMAGAWIEFCLCDELSSSSVLQENSKKQKTN